MEWWARKCGHARTKQTEGGPGQEAAGHGWKDEGVVVVWKRLEVRRSVKASSQLFGWAYPFCEGIARRWIW